MYLIFDTETTGFPLKDFKDINNPRLIQLAWALVNEDGKLFKSASWLIEPCGWEIPSVKYFISKGLSKEDAEVKAKFWVDNGFSQEVSLKQGRPIEFVIKHFIEAIEDCKYMVAHNMKFDLAIMASEIHRQNKFAKNKPIKLCTMLGSTEILQLPGKYGFKRPSLTELHTFLFEKGFEGAHDALADVKACANCFFELKNRKLIMIPKIEEPKKEPNE